MIGDDNLKYSIDESKLPEAKLQAESELKEGIVSKLNKVVEYCLENDIKAD